MLTAFLQVEVLEPHVRQPMARGQDVRRADDFLFDLGSCRWVGILVSQGVGERTTK